MKKNLLLFLFLCLVEMAFSQNQNRVTDSIKQVLKTVKEDTTKVNILNSLTESLWESGDFRSALSNANEALSLAETINFKKGIANAYNNIGFINKRQGNYIMALENYSIALKIYEEIKLKKDIINTNNNIANVYSLQGNNTQALKHYLDNLKIEDEIGDKRAIGNTENSIGNIYESMGNYSEAMKNYSTALKIYEEIGYKQGVADVYNNIGILYTEKGDYKEALKNYLTGLKICESIGDNRNIVAAYINLADLNIRFKKIAETKKYLIKSLRLAEEIGNKMDRAASYITFGELYIQMQQLPEAKEYLIKGLLLSKEIGAKYLTRNCYADLAKVDSITGDFKSANQYLKLYGEIKDSILYEESNRTIAQLKIQYEIEKKDKEIALLNNENKITVAKLEKQRIIKYVVFSFSVLIVLIALLIVNNIRTKNKARQLTNANNIRQRISRDLHDEIGAGLTSISMVCEQGKIKAANKISHELLLYDKISAQSRNISEQLNEVVWATNPENDNLSSLLSYIRNYVSKFFEDSSIKYSLSLPDEMPDLPLKPDMSRNLFYVLKEVMNNCVKHSGASLIEILFRFDNDKNYLLWVNDNGKGIDIDSLPPLHRNGFGNMRRRIEDINGKFEISSELGKGTHIKISGSLS